MAYVAITKALTQEVGNAVNRMKEAELASLPKKNVIYDSLSDLYKVKTAVIDLLWKPIEDLRPRLEQYSREAHVKVQANVVLPDVPEPFFVEFTALMDNVPPIYSSRTASNPYQVTSVLATIDVTDIPQFAEYAQAALQHKEVETRWAAVAKQVHDFLSSCKSLNEAVKLWPDVIRYIPKSYLDRLNQKTEKVVEASKALEALRNMDFDTINTSTVLARMAGAK